VTDLHTLALLVVATPAAASLLTTVAPTSLVRPLAVGAAIVVAAVSALLATVALADPFTRSIGKWIVVDPAAAALVVVITVVALPTVVLSSTYIGGTPQSLVGAARRERAYYTALFAFWALLLAVPLAGNLGLAWLLLEATTAASALLVGFSGRGRALEAAWKYLILTSLGLGFALLGVVLLAAGPPLGGLEGLTWRSLPRFGDPDTALVAFLLLMAGLAAKIGWAPVHNWLPDAHSEAPAPVSALLSGALLPTALLVAWRSADSLGPVVGETTAQAVLVGFGLASLAVAVPFLWRALAWKRLLAYSSLEHMGVIALGVGFGTPLALAGVLVHLVAHALAKSLGFYAATPLLAHEPRAARHAVGGIGRTEPRLAGAMSISLATLAGLPPLPLFVSEVLIVAGGFDAGRPWAAGAAGLLLALGFLGLVHSLIEVTAGKGRRHRLARPPGLHGVTAFSAVTVVLLLSLSVAAWALVSSDVVKVLARGIA
jgi:hydrogenase-4 component F